MKKFWLPLLLLVLLIIAIGFKVLTKTRPHSNNQQQTGVKVYNIGS